MPAYFVEPTPPLAESFPIGAEVILTYGFGSKTRARVAAHHSRYSIRLSDGSLCSTSGPELVDTTTKQNETHPEQPEAAMNQHVQPPIDIEKRIGQYLSLRSKIKGIEDRHKEELKPYKDALEQLNAMLLNHLNNINTDSANVRDVGTVYRTAKKSASIADAAAFRRFIIGGEFWDLVDWRANAPAVEGFIEENKAPPPGVNFSTTHVVGVRKA